MNVLSMNRAAVPLSLLVLPLLWLASVQPVDGEGIELHPRAPISIEGDPGLIPSNGVLFGSGTEQDPYEISLFDFDLDHGAGIRINGTTAHVMISLCRFHGGFLNGTVGIHISNSTNVTVQHTVAYLVGTGMVIEDCTDVRMFYPTVMYAGNGIVLRSSADIMIVTAESSRNDVNGMVMEDCKNVQVMDSVFDMNSPRLGADNGLLLVDSSDVWIWKCSFTLNYGDGVALYGSEGMPAVNVTMEECIIDSDVNGLWAEHIEGLRVLNCRTAHNTYGMFLFNCSGAVVSNCTLFKNTCGLLLELSDGCTAGNCHFEANDEGARLVSSRDNTIYGNSFANSSGYAVLINGLGTISVNSSGNVLHSNLFLWNKGRLGQVMDQGEDDSWDDGSKGNYWSDHQDPDANKDGTVDVPKNITRDGSVADRYPMVHPMFHEEGADQAADDVADDGLKAGQAAFLFAIIILCIALLIYALRANKRSMLHDSGHEMK